MQDIRRLKQSSELQSSFECLFEEVFEITKTYSIDSRRIIEIAYPEDN